MVKLSTSIVTVALLSVPAIATSSKQYKRSITTRDVYGRGLSVDDNILAIRDELLERELVNDLEERNSGVAENLELARLRRARRAAARSSDGFGSTDSSNTDSSNNGGRRRRFRWFGREFQPELRRRDLLEDLETREPVNVEALVKGLHALHKAHKAASAGSQFIPQSGNGDNGGNRRRDLSDEGIHAREPVDVEALVKGIHALHKAHKAASKASQFVPPSDNGENGGNRRRGWDDEEFFERDFDLEEREPHDHEAIAKEVQALRKAHRAARAAFQSVPQGSNNGDNQPRDVYDQDMFGRDIEDFFPREFFDDLD